MPGITYAIGTVDYDPTFDSFAAATTYRIDTTIYGRSADQVTEIHDQVKLALSNVSSQVFTCRVTDERYQVDVDNNHMAEVQSMWLMDAGIEEGTATLISPAFQGYDKMKVEYAYKLGSGNTDLELDKQVYYLDFSTSSGQGTHTLTLPNAKTHVGKMYTIITGTNTDNNTYFRLLPFTGQTVETTQYYDLNRPHASATIVALKLSGGESPAYGWRVVWYHGLHN